MANFRYTVELTRRVAEPTYGPQAYRSDTLRKEFPFGKGKEFPNGKAAFAAAESYAKSMLDQASSVSVWRMAGGSGLGNYLKDEPDSRFALGWPEKAALHT